MCYCANLQGNQCDISLQRSSFLIQWQLNPSLFSIVHHPFFLSDCQSMKSTPSSSATLPSHPSPLFSFFFFVTPPLPTPFSLSGAPVRPHSFLPRHFPLLRCTADAPSLVPSPVPSLSLWAGKWGWRGPPPDAGWAGPVAGNAPVTRGERAWLPQRLSQRHPGTGHHCESSGFAEAPFDWKDTKNNTITYINLSLLYSEMHLSFMWWKWWGLGNTQCLFCVYCVFW